MHRRDLSRSVAVSVLLIMTYVLFLVWGCLVVLFDDSGRALIGVLCLGCGSCLAW